MKKFIYLTVIALFVFKTSQSATYYLKSGGTMTVLTSWGVNTDGSGTAPTGFSGAHVWNVHNNSTISLITTFGVSSTATVNVGDGISPITFYYSGVAKLGITTFCNLNVNNNSVFVVDKAYGTINGAKTNINAGSTFSYTPNADFIGGDSYGNLVCGATLFLNGNSTVNSILTISAGNSLDLDISTLTINGSIANTTGNFIGNNFGAGLILGGTGNMGSLNFLSGSAILSNLNISMLTPASFITLNSNLTVDDLTAGSINLTNGGIKLNGFSITTTSLITFTGGSALIYGSGVESINIYSNAMSGNLTMDATLNSLKALNLYSSGSLTLGSALNILDSVKISGATLNTAGILTLKSNSALKARIAEISGGGTLSGNINVETFIPGGTTDWAVLGASGVSGLTFNSWYPTIPMAIEGSPTGVTSVGGMYFESVQGWNEADIYGYDTTLTISSPISVGKGYWLFVGTGLTTTSDIITTVTGPPVTGPQSLSLSNSAQLGNCLLANPYPSPISWDKINAANPGITTGAIYVYNADLGLTTSYAGGVSTPGGPGSISSTIPMGQGFYVVSNGASPISITESSKVSNNTGSNPLLKSNATTAASIGSVLRLQLNGGGYMDETAIRFHSAATTAYDNSLDATKYFDSPGYAGYPGVWSKRTTISTKSLGNDYSINSLPFPTSSNAVIPVLARVYATGQHTISAIGISNLPSGTCVDLKDKLLNIVHDLTTSPYVCNLSDTATTARFDLIVCTSIAMGVNNVSPDAVENVFIKQDANGIYVDLSFEKNTKATITANNILGQQIMLPKEIECVSGKYYLDLQAKEQVVMINVITSEKRHTKKTFIPQN